MRSLGLFLLAILMATPTSAQVTVFNNATVFGATNPGQGLTVVNGRLVPPRKRAPDRVIDLQGGFVVPRLVDGHGHLLSLGRSLSRVDLRGASTWAEVIERTKRGAPPSGWVFGRGWDQNRFEGKAFPTHHALSAAFPDRPVVLRRVDGHALVANAAALAAAGITSSTAAPEGGRILKDSKGQPTGVLIDHAMPLLMDKRPQASPEQRRRWLKAACQKALSVGLTGMHDMGMDQETIGVMKLMDAAGELPIRVYAYTDGVVADQKPHSGKRFSVVGVKLFADGALGSRGAALLAPYDDRADWNGQMLSRPEDLANQVRAARAAGLQPAIHAIGDRGVRAAILALQASGGPLPGRLEHAQIVAAEDFARIKEAGLVASMQPTHATSDMPWAEARVGAQRIVGGYAWRTMLQHGIPLVFGSDFPVERPHVLEGIYAAVTRQDSGQQPAGGWYPKQRVTVAEALTAFSSSAANVVGDPVPWADFTVFDRDLRTVPAADILKARVRMVVVGGDVVYRARGK